ncbi:hypothetical protein CEXT_745741 [Caerostris extrusa]|uniref:Uncharacterized protein n=1 Tax=Caerostris extrusa TaxID=172846 RepID=A0AAV4TMD8_CAEEX|nr:hypothetical protein CEXT_745741 [Caerostris extrusa]
MDQVLTWCVDPSEREIKGEPEDQKAKAADFITISICCGDLKHLLQKRVQVKSASHIKANRSQTRVEFSSRSNAGHDASELRERESVAFVEGIVSRRTIRCVRNPEKWRGTHCCAGHEERHHMTAGETTSRGPVTQLGTGPEPPRDPHTRFRLSLLPWRRVRTWGRNCCSGATCWDEVEYRS